MNIRCPECATVFRVDPARIPPAGVRARCSRCSASFRITPDGLGETRPPAATGQGGAAPGTDRAAAQSTSGPPAAQTETRPADETAGAAAHGTAGAAAHETAGAAAGGATRAQSTAAPEARSTATPAASPGSAPGSSTAAGTSTGAGAAAASQAPAETPRTPVFGSRDPNARAQRIARALVSDIVAYHPEKREHCLANGTLRSGFRDEIMKSWEEYVAQVGLDMAKTTPYFREALNNILAGGQQVF